VFKCFGCIRTDLVVHEFLTKQNDPDWESAKSDLSYELLDANTAACRRKYSWDIM